MADNVKYRFIQNVGDYFPAGYFGEDFLDKVQNCAGYNSDQMKELCSPFVSLRREYDDYKNQLVNGNLRVKDNILYTHQFHTRLLKILGYETEHSYAEKLIINDDHDILEFVPVRHILRDGDQTKMLVMEMQSMVKTGEEEPAGLFNQMYDDGLGDEPTVTTQQRYRASQWESVFQFDVNQYKIAPAIINKAVSQIFLLPEQQRPHFILLLAGNMVFLFDQDKWARGSYLQFSFDELFSQGAVKAFRNYYALFHLLVCKETLAGTSGTVLMDTIIEESYKNAYEVTKDLKEGVVSAVETLANEALYYMKQVAHRPFGKYDPITDTYDETDDSFEAEVKDDCLTIVYRLLFIFYAESRDDLEILPCNDEVYNRGYSLEMLRDLEQVRLESEESREGYFFDDSFRHLFHLLSAGHHENQVLGDKSFRVRPIDSPLFDDKKLHHLKDVRIRNLQWQSIIRSLSLSHRGKVCGRISYANLGVNQLGSVYESLLAYRGFYAEEDYIEVHKADKPEDGTFLVPYSRMGDFDLSEILKDESGEPVVLPKGTFVYRLNGRDRQKSASYYTPEVLTRSTVKYTLKTILDEIKEGKRKAMELLDLKILEPAMGAAAFQNEVINQVAEAYLTYQQQDLKAAGRVNWRIEPDQYRNELQKVKAYIATHNVYGVDLNPTAIELGKLSLWLNVMHKDMETPFFSNRLAVGNAVVGAWLKVYRKEEVLGIPGRKSKLIPNAWWEKAPTKVTFHKNSVARSVNEVYHFLLPDKNMLGVRSIKEQKDEHTNEFKVMKTLVDDWTKPIGIMEFRTLQRLSAKIDKLLKDYFAFQISLEHLTNNKKNIWGVPGDAVLNLDPYAEKERLNNTRYRHDNAYYKLKMVMDYWCALWFWEYEETTELPTREQYWADIEALLDVKEEEMDSRTRRALERGVNDVNEPEVDYGHQSEEESEIVEQSKAQILAETRGQTQLFTEPARFQNVKRYADRYHFFHPMLEFLEVFWLRGGFDIICGNPPWLPLKFNVGDILSDNYPEIKVHDWSAAEISLRLKELLSVKDLSIKYRSEQLEMVGSTAFINAKVNYYALGGKSNLFKCILLNCFDLLNDYGYIGMLHPESVYDEVDGGELRKILFHRLRWHFQYQNELLLFSEVDHHTKYGCQIYGRYNSTVCFESIQNLFHPNTIDYCFTHNGQGCCQGIKDENGNWNINAHKDRIITISNKELESLALLTNNKGDVDTTCLISIHAKEIMNTLIALSQFPKHLRDQERIIDSGLNETGAQKSRVIEKNVGNADWNKLEMIYCGPNVAVSNPFYKTPRLNYIKNSDYDVIDLNSDFLEKLLLTKYKPIIPIFDYRNLCKGFKKGQDTQGNEVYDNWWNYFKIGIREMVGADSERSLQGAILPPQCRYVNTIISVCFKSNSLLLEAAGLISSLFLDFFIKVGGTGTIHVYPQKIDLFPLGIDDKFKNSLFVRVLRLNCLTKRYSLLWESSYKKEFALDQWSQNDKRLSSYGSLSNEWNNFVPLINWYERRFALIEIDVIVAMALGLSLNDLEIIYNLQFGVLKKYENDTWYDRHGCIVFTNNSGLNGVGVDRLTWNTIKDLPAGETYVHTIDPKKSELYGGQQVTYYAPFDKCDRIADYRRAWAFFEKRFNAE